MTDKSKVSIGLLNPKSPTNVGGILRACGCFGADAVYFTGTRFARASKYQTDTKKIAQNITLNAVSNLFDAVAEKQRVVCVELVEGASPLPQFVHPEFAFYIFGPEDGTLDQDIINRADDVVYVPTKGCMNLAATVNVLLYDRLAKLSPTLEGDELIRKYRDNNNRLSL